MKPRPDRPILRTSSQWRIDRYCCASAGVAIGVVLASLIALVVGWTLDSWRVAAHERLTAEAVAAVDARLGDCRKDLARYSDIAALERDAVAAMGEAMITDGYLGYWSALEPRTPQPTLNRCPVMRWVWARLVAVKK